ncbi:Transcriptional regulator PadR-like family protein [Corynebacterium choanae]|uniref:Transcriptional regulator PadR-like family protein n=2 Tax=Corynebacterium choanae TaxID=1862358 RepID=A0A3G6J9B8_9CORY|nr:Transcriptional regulator PadR-like family protein [Corynebacterium choanae]
MKDALLYLLDDQPRAVAQLKKTFETMTQDLFPVNVGQVYQTVQRLERDGLVVVAHDEPDPATGRPVSVYTTTPPGHDAAQAWLSSPSIQLATARDELVMKVTLTIESGGDLPAVIDQERAAVLNAIRQAMVQRSTATDLTSAVRLTAEKRIYDLEAIARWLDFIDNAWAQHAAGGKGASQ